MATSPRSRRVYASARRFHTAKTHNRNLPGEKLASMKSSTTPLLDQAISNSRLAPATAQRWPNRSRSSRWIVICSLRLAAADEVAGEVGEQRARQRRKRQGPRDLDRGEPEPRGEQAVEHAFAEPRREFGRNAVAEHLLDEAVAGRHAAGEREMRHDVPEQADQAEQAG